MAAANKFNDFVNQLGLAKHQFSTDVQKVMLALTAPVATNSVKGDITEIAAGNGYTSGGNSIANSWASVSGVGTLTGTKVTWTASGGNIADFRYVVLYNDTQTSPSKPLLLYWDNGSTVTLATGATFTVKFNSGDPTGTVLTIA